MKKYELNGDYPLRHNGKEYQPGDTVEMDEAAAASKVESGRLIEIGAGKKTDDDGKDSAPESASEDKGGDAKSSGATGGRKAGGK